MNWRTGRTVDLSGLPGPTRIRLVGLPPGSAPEEVRRAFVGQELDELTSPALAVDDLGDPMAFVEGGHCRVDALGAVRKVGANNPAVERYFASHMQLHQSVSFMFPAGCFERL